jgi:hypothetical protein
MPMIYITVEQMSAASNDFIVYKPVFIEMFGEYGMELTVENLSSWFSNSKTPSYMSSLNVNLIADISKRKQFLISHQAFNTYDDAAKLFIELYSGKKQSLVDKIVSQALR